MESVPHGGRGVGIERLVSCLTGITNVKIHYISSDGIHIVHTKLF